MVVVRRIRTAARNSHVIELHWESEKNVNDMHIDNTVWYKIIEAREICGGNRGTPF